MTQVFVVNSGSSSIKYQLIDSRTENVLLSGIIDRIGEPGHAADHDDAMRIVLAALGDTREITVVGHRVVHGGSRFTRATVVTPEVEKVIDRLSALAPLHNPANLAGIRAASAAFPGVPQVAVFDTAFHQTLSAEAYTYAIEADVAKAHGIRRYGFHGTSHKFVSDRTAAQLSRPLSDLKLVIFHLGNGASVCAVDGGRSVEISMGLTPLEGLVMGTRSGDIDPAVLFHLARVAGMDSAALDDLLNRRSGLLGMTGTGDMRDARTAAAAGDEAARAGLNVYVHRLRHYLGAYLAHLGGAHAIVFTAGVGENSPETREETIRGFEWLGIEIDRARNEAPERGVRVISTDASSVTVLVVPTNEELEIARQSLACV